MELTKKEWKEEYEEALAELPDEAREKVIKGKLPIVIYRHFVWPDGTAEFC